MTDLPEYRQRTVGRCPYDSISVSHLSSDRHVAAATAPFPIAVDLQRLSRAPSSAILRIATRLRSGPTPTAKRDHKATHRLILAGNLSNAPTVRGVSRLHRKKGLPNDRLPLLPLTLRLTSQGKQMTKGTYLSAAALVVVRRKPSGPRWRRGRGRKFRSSCSRLCKTRQTPLRGLPVVPRRPRRPIPGRTAPVEPGQRGRLHAELPHVAARVRAATLPRARSIAVPPLR